jgi:tetratricopeptide (TPR) repeat protein
MAFKDMYKRNKSNKDAFAKIILLSLFCLGSMAEFISINYFLISYISINFYIFLSAHIIGSILISLTIPYIIKPLYENCRLKYFLFSLAMLTFIPVLGVFVLVVIFRPKKNSTISQYSKTVNTSLSQRNIRNLSIKHINPNSGCIVSTNSITSLLTTSDIIAEERQKAVLDTIKLPDKEAVPLLRKALEDDEDDVRLLAYALLKRKENTVTSRLQNRLKELNEANGPSPVSLHKAIAYDCWEIIYLDLMQGELQKHLFELAIKHITISLKYNDNDPGLNILFAKILLRKGNLSKSRKLFIKASMTGIDRNRILPYFAEIAFLEKKFCIMSKFINDISNDASSYKISRPTEFINDG